ncbi:MAG: SoxR reducing system RseC family protein [Tannerella sp.]|jgi:sigma-E factor negative regulatory protein RseC|nr:SoxR reducing system RseC family protein [Tannerella sp.]
MKKSIQHSGVIAKIEHSTVHVRIVQQSACSECHAKSLCHASDRSVKMIEIEDHSGSFSVNETVHIHAHMSQGMTAVLIAFVVPLALVVAALAAGYAISGNDIVAGVAALCILAPYCAVVRLMRGRLAKKFVFTLSKIS